ncbi:hypothetical protein FHW37_101699 [Neorhizobium alkalisoli]|uniref:Uncharacterized protein n=1 Tax=Neorhizobium alkalisoli TaxID=528178 RepID=A0A561R8G4_9HYPH|nr:hypothetical protein FHW37_101699 [Neorhizobium alkalisoli]
MSAATMVITGATVIVGIIIVRTTVPGPATLEAPAGREIREDPDAPITATALAGRIVPTITTGAIRTVPAQFTVDLIAASGTGWAIPIRAVQGAFCRRTDILNG